MATKKVKKFGRGGDILTGLGAGLAGYGIYKAMTKDKDKDDSGSGASLKKPTISEEVEKAQKGADREVSAGERRATAASKGRSEMVPEGADKDIMESDKDAKRVGIKPAPKVVAPKAAAPKAAAPKAAAPKADTAPKAVTKASTSKDGFGKIKPLGEESSVAKTMRESRAQRLGTNYNAQYKALQTAPEGPGKEALKKSVEKAKQDYDAAVKGMRKGGTVKKYASGGSVKTAKPTMRSASSRADGIAIRGKTRA